MKKYLFFIICGTGLLVTSVSAQNSAGIVNEAKTNETKTNGDIRNNILKAKNNVMIDETLLLNILGIGESVFTVSNMADGTEKSYVHEMRIVLTLNIAEKKTEKFQLVFYSSQDKIPFAVANEISAFSVFYPLSMYESIKEKLDQSLAAKKKIQLKVVRKTDGYREGTLIF